MHDRLTMPANDHRYTHPQVAPVHNDPTAHPVSPALRAWLKQDVGPLVRAQWAMQTMAVSAALRQPLTAAE